MELVAQRGDHIIERYPMERIRLLAGLGLSVILGCGAVTPDEMAIAGEPGPMGAPGQMGNRALSVPLGQPASVAGISI